MHIVTAGMNGTGFLEFENTAKCCNFLRTDNNESGPLHGNIL